MATGRRRERKSTGTGRIPCGSRPVPRVNPAESVAALDNPVDNVETGV